jgi:hypothetical protein
LLARELHDVAHGKKIRLVSKVPDDRELVLDELADAVGHTFRISPFRAEPGEPHQLVIGRRALASGFQRVLIVVADLVEREVEPLEHGEAFADGARILGEEPRYLRRALHVPLGIRLQELAGGFQRPVLTHAGEHVLQSSPLRRVIEHVAERQHGDAVAGGKCSEFHKPPAVIAAVEAVGPEANMAGKSFVEGSKCSF